VRTHTRTHTHTCKYRETRGADVSLDECEEMIGSIDADGDGVISFEEFAALHNDHML
jgi:Ca2+-binding EF-hand superfamily protein